MIAVKVHRSYRCVVALADSSLIGKVFEQGKRQLDVRASFFKQDELTHEQAVKLIKEQAKEDSTFNIVGPLAVKAALESGLITKENIAHVQNIPFTLVLI